jgi:ribonuclease HI
LKATAWIDGASRGNPGEAGFGVLVESGVGDLEICGFLGRTTNNVAEYAGLIAALTWARDNEVDELTLYSDSLLLINQLTGAYKVKAPHLIPIFLQALELKRGIRSVTARHVRREQNSKADGLANRAVDERTPLPAWLELEVPGQ